MSLELERERVVQELCSAYAYDHLSTGELESRLERVYKLEERSQLLTLLEGLPAARLPVPLAHASPAPLARPATLTPGRALPADERRYVAIFSEVKKEGAWTPTPRITALTVFGSVLLDLREATIPANGIDIEIEVVMGEAKILLPPGVGADVDCTSVLATVEDKSRPAFPGAPVVRVRGGTVMGSISVITKVPKKERVDSWRRQLKEWLGTPD
jgi:hypothetical protein